MTITIPSLAHSGSASMVYRQIPFLLQNVVHLSIDCHFDWPCDLRSLYKCTSLYIKRLNNVTWPENLRTLWLTKTPKTKEYSRNGLFSELLHGTIVTLHLQELREIDYDNLWGVVDFYSPNFPKPKLRTII